MEGDLGQNSKLDRAKRNLVVSLVGRAPNDRAGGCGVQTPPGPTLKIFK